MPVYCRLYYGRSELCGDGASGAHARHDAYALAADDLGDLYGHSACTAGVSCAIGCLYYDVV